MSSIPLSAFTQIMHAQHYALFPLSTNLQCCTKVCFSLLLILLDSRRFSRREESSMAEIHTRTPVLAEDTELGVGRLTGDIVEVINVITNVIIVVLYYYYEGGGADHKLPHGCPQHGAGGGHNL